MKYMEDGGVILSSLMQGYEKLVELLHAQHILRKLLATNECDK